METRELILQAPHLVILHGGPPECGVVRDQGVIDWVADGIEYARRAGLSVEEVAAIALFRTTTGHPFMDGNHRTGVALLLALLLYDGFELRVSNREIGEFSKSVDRDELSLGDVVAWIRMAAISRRPKAEAPVEALIEGASLIMPEILDRYSEVFRLLA